MGDPSRSYDHAPPPWLALLRRLTEVSPDWVVWKNVDAALNGVGDIDAAASRADWDVIAHEFRRWAAGHALGPVIVCHHIPGGLNIVAAPPGMPTLLEVGVKERRIWRGATLFVLEDLRPLMEMDPRGFRRVRLGAEGVFKLVLNGVRWGGRPDWEGLRAKRVVEHLRADPAGVRMAARLFGPAQDALLAGAERVVAGGWDRAAMVKVESWALLRALRTPRVVWDRARFRLGAKAACPIVSAILDHHRRIPEDRESWLRQVARNHVIYHDGAGVE
jgi:hypothetical protein